MISVDELEPSARKGKFAVTPPTSPSSVSSFSSQPNGFFARSLSTTPTDDDIGIDGHFKFLENATANYPAVFTITNGQSDTLKSHQAGSPKSGYDNVGFDNRGSNFSEDKYRWTDTDGPTTASGGDKTKSKTNTRKICIAVFVTLLVLAILAGIAVILAYKVFDVGERKDVPEVSTTIRPDILTLDGSLDLKQTWRIELNDPTSSLFISTARNFTSEIDRIMENSSFSDVYIRTEVVGFSPGSIKVDFKMLHNDRYKTKADTASEYATAVQEHIINSAQVSVLPIDETTVNLRAVEPSSQVTKVPSTSTSSPLPSSPSFATSQSIFTTAMSTGETSTPNSVSTKSSTPFTSTILATGVSSIETSTQGTVSTQSSASLTSIISTTVLSTVGTSTQTITASSSAHLTSTAALTTLLTSTQDATSSSTFSDSSATSIAISPSSSTQTFISTTYPTSVIQTTAPVSSSKSVESPFSSMSTSGTQSYVSDSITSSETSTEIEFTSSETTTQFESSITGTAPTSQVTHSSSSAFSSLPSLLSSTTVTKIFPSFTTSLETQSTKESSYLTSRYWSTTQYLNSTSTVLTSQSSVTPSESPHMTSSEITTKPTSIPTSSEWIITSTQTAKPLPYEYGTLLSVEETLTDNLSNSEHPGLPISSVMSTMQRNVFTANRKNNINADNVTDDSATTYSSMGFTDETIHNPMTTFSQQSSSNSLLLNNITTNGLYTSFQDTSEHIDSSSVSNGIVGVEVASTSDEYTLLSDKSVILNETLYTNQTLNIHVKHHMLNTDEMDNATNKSPAVTDTDPNEENSFFFSIFKSIKDTLWSWTNSEKSTIPLSSTINMLTEGKELTSIGVFSNSVSSGYVTLIKSSKNSIYQNIKTNAGEDQNVSLWFLETSGIISSQTSADPRDFLSLNQTQITTSQIHNLSYSDNIVPSRPLHAPNTDNPTSLSHESLSTFLSKQLLTLNVNHVSSENIVNLPVFYNTNKDLKNMTTENTITENSSRYKLQENVSSQILDETHIHSTQVDVALSEENAQTETYAPGIKTEAFENDGMYAALTNLSNTSNSTEIEAKTTTTREVLHVSHGLLETSNIISMQTSVNHQGVHSLGQSQITTSIIYDSTNSDSIVPSGTVQASITDITHSLSSEIVSLFLSKPQLTLTEAHIPYNSSGNRADNLSSVYSTIKDLNTSTNNITSIYKLQNTMSSQILDETSIPSAQVHVFLNEKVLAETQTDTFAYEAFEHKGTHDVHHDVFTTVTAVPSTSSTGSYESSSTFVNLVKFKSSSFSDVLIDSSGTSMYPTKSALESTIVSTLHRAISSINKHPTEHNVHSELTSDMLMSSSDIHVKDIRPSKNVLHVALPNHGVESTNENVHTIVLATETLHMSKELIKETDTDVLPSVNITRMNEGNETDTTFSNSSTLTIHSNVNISSSDEIILKPFDETMTIDLDTSTSHVASRMPLTSEHTSFSSIQPTPSSPVTSSSTSVVTSTTPSTTTETTTPSTTPSTTTEAIDEAPVANAGDDTDIYLPTDTIILNGSGSTDDYGIVQWQWLKVSPDNVDVGMQGAQNASLTVSNLQEGVYVFSLTVKDRRGQENMDSVKVTVNPSLCTPVEFAPCSTRGFTQTVLPNLFNHENISNAEAAFNMVTKDILNQICQESALTYLCALYFPKCDIFTGIQEFPCNSLCTEAVNTCGNYFTNPFDCQYFLDTDCTALITTTPAPVTTAAPNQCVATLVPDCASIGFNETFFPNLIGEPSQEGAYETFYGYFKFSIDEGCHADVLYFICSVQFPKCTQTHVYKPCRRVCKDIQISCPDIGDLFDCSDYPAIDCMAPAKPQAAAQRTKHIYRRVCDAVTEFTCGQVTKCISQDLVCNGVNDCSDWTDEMNCQCDREYEFQCDMGMCIKSYQQCDGTPQCPDNSDERECKCTHGQVACPSGKCIMAEWLCDGRSECEDGWDEFNCDVCARNEFTCADRNRTCIALLKRCNGYPDCPGGYDEFECINDDLGDLRLPIRKTELPICADSWEDYYGNYTCNLLGRGRYISKTDVVSNLPTFIKLAPSSSSYLPSVLGPVDIEYQCKGNKAMKINCEPRGCGKRQMPISNNYIVNGDPAPPGAWPWHVALYYGGQYFCGGSLISDEFVLTAAHCVEKYGNAFNLMTVKLGANNRERGEETQHVVKVEAVHSHTDHVYFIRNDIALIQLERPVNYSKYIQPICLPEKDENLPLYSTCYTVGWGRTKWGGDYADVLQQLKMTLWDTKKCNSSIAWDGDIYDTFLCAGYFSGVRSICTGDSGGPLLCLDSTHTWKVFGVSSYVANFCNMTERPNIFTNVRDLLPWINDIIDVKFECTNGKRLYNREYICDRVDHCGDNSDETRDCNFTVTCDFEDKFLCGYEFSGWQLGQDNKLSTRQDIGGQLHTQSNAPQFDNSIGRYPGHFFYGKDSSVRDADLWTPKFNSSGQTCIRFAYYQRGDVSVGLKVMLYEYTSGTDTLSTRWPVHAQPKNSPDEWKTGYFDINLGEFKLQFTTGDLLTAAIDDVQTIPGMCMDVLCKSSEFWCKGTYGDKCIPKESECNLLIDCEDRDSDEKNCAKTMGSYICTFENGNVCGLQQEVNDGTDWWLVNATFIQKEINNKKFKDHTTGTDNGHLFYLSAYGIQSNSHIYMSQSFYLHSVQHCLSFYYQMRSDVTFEIQVECEQGCSKEVHLAQSTFEDNWALFQVTLPLADVIYVTYDVIGESVNLFYSFIVMDDIYVRRGVCPEYVCPANYTKCRMTDRCIPVTTVCDRKVDCLDEFDEESCVCNATEYQCNNGRCLPLINKCDRTEQCLDGSDEGTVCKPLELVSCTFEHPYMCGYKFVNYTNYKWRRHSGYTLTPQTGPNSDNTFGNALGHYLYAEANEGGKGDNASVISPSFNTGSGHSIEFYYHIFSSNPKDYKPGKLEFRMINELTQETIHLWESDPYALFDKWIKYCFNLPAGLTMKASFTTIRTETTMYGVDIAIDDVQINTFTCEEATTPTTRLTSATDTTKPEADGCGNDKWKCRSGQCITKSYRCDGDSDCIDGSDEQNCP